MMHLCLWWIIEPSCYASSEIILNSCRNVNSIEHTTSAEMAGFG